MSAPNDGGPAFPVREAERFNPENNETHAIEQHWGMTLRDWFAGQALAGLLACARLPELLEGCDLDDAPRAICEKAYEAAGAMLKVRAQ